MNAGKHAAIRAATALVLSAAGLSLNGPLLRLEAAAPAPQRRSEPQKAGDAEPSTPDSTRRLSMTPAVACASISAYQQYEPLAEAAVTKDEKLLIYYEPLNFAYKKVDGKFQAHLVQDVRIRRRGRKEVLWSREKLFEYKPEGPQPNLPINLTNRIALKGLQPGDYDLDIILHDLVAGDPPAQQVLRFAVKPAPPPSAPAPKGNKTKRAQDDEEQEESPGSR